MRPAARLRLFCFHHAGGSAALYRELREELAPDIDVLPVQLPGREGRVDDVLPNRMDALVAELDEQLDTVLAAPYALYGHSMGALIAYELTRHRIGARPRAAAGRPTWSLRKRLGSRCCRRSPAVSFAGWALRRLCGRLVDNALQWSSQYVPKSDPQRGEHEPRTTQPS